MNNKISIVEGPPPTFEPVPGDWASAVINGTHAYGVVMTHLRTMNGTGLIERCHQTWNQQDTMVLQYRNEYGEHEMPIIAARAFDTDEGQKITLWLRVRPEQIKFEVSYGDDEAQD